MNGLFHLARLEENIMDDNRFYETNLSLIECLNSLNARENLTKEEVNDCVIMFDNLLAFCVDIGIISDYDIDELEGFLEKLVMK